MVFCAVCSAAVTLLVVGGPAVLGSIVTTVALFVAVVRPEAVSVAVMIDAEPLTALPGLMTNPVALTVAAAVFDDSKTSDPAESVWADPSL